MSPRRRTRPTLVGSLVEALRGSSYPTGRIGIPWNGSSPQWNTTARIWRCPQRTHAVERRQITSTQRVTDAPRRNAAEFGCGNLTQENLPISHFEPPGLRFHWSSPTGFGIINIRECLVTEAVDWHQRQGIELEARRLHHAKRESAHQYPTACEHSCAERQSDRGRSVHG